MHNFNLLFFNVIWPFIYHRVDLFW